MNLKILFMKWYQIHNFSFFVKSYASVHLPKIQKFIKNRKQFVKSLQYQNVGQKLFAQLLRPGKKMIQLLDINAQQILILGLKMIKQGQNKISRALI